jgi:two-component system response regulator HupR/HoxA
MVCDWVGNIRQLCNELQRIVVRADDNEIITPEHLSPELRRTSLPLSQEPSSINLTDESSAAVFSVKRETGTLDEVISQIESRVILEALQRHNGNVSRVARELDISRRNLYMKLERYNLIKPNNPLSKFNIS